MTHNNALYYTREIAKLVALEVEDSYGVFCNEGSSLKLLTSSEVQAQFDKRFMRKLEIRALYDKIDLAPYLLGAWLAYCDALESLGVE